MDSYLVHRNKKPLIYYFTLRVTYLFNELPYTKKIQKNTILLKLSETAIY